MLTSTLYLSRSQHRPQSPIKLSPSPTHPYTHLLQRAYEITIVSVQQPWLLCQGQYALYCIFACGPLCGLDILIERFGDLIEGQCQSRRKNLSTYIHSFIYIYIYI